MQPMKYRRDPAPSVLRYRLGRLWLTPSFRRIVKFGPIVTVLLGAVFYLLTSQSFKEGFAQFSQNTRDGIIGRAEFRVTEMKVHGASAGLQAQVEQAAAVTLPTSSLEIDLVDLRQRLETLPRVASAAVRVSSNGVLQVNLSERVPAVVWRGEGGLRLFSGDGVELGQIATRLDRADLPLIAGNGATDHIEEAMELFSISSAINDRVRGLQRVGTRRWSLILDRGQEIYLPETGATTALLRVMATHATDDLLNKDVVIVDLRNPSRPVLRLGPMAVSELQSKNLSVEEGAQ